MWRPITARESAYAADEVHPDDENEDGSICFKI